MSEPLPTACCADSIDAISSGFSICSSFVVILVSVIGATLELALLQIRCGERALAVFRRISRFRTILATPDK